MMALAMTMTTISFSKTRKTNNDVARNAILSLLYYFSNDVKRLSMCSVLRT